ncbi:MAG: LysR family transcriptional regulator [Clostridia bacterium]|nr:LysR family transcriptional regulator [Clostridia bacterium]
MLNPKHAPAILAIAREGSITAAARKLFISQPALSQTLKTVEQELGAALFSREGASLRLTHAGELYIEAVRQINTINSNLMTAIDESRGVAYGSFTLGIAPQRGIQLMPQVLPAFGKKYPNVKIRLIEDSSQRLEALIREGQCDIAFVTVADKRDQLYYIPVEEERFVLTAAKSTRLARTFADGTEIDLSVAAEEQFISMPEGHCIRDVQDKLCAQYGFAPRIILETRVLETAKRLTAETNSVFFVPDIYVESDPAFRNKVCVYPVRNNGHRRLFYFCHRKDLEPTNYEMDLVRLVFTALGRPFPEPQANP